MTNMKLRWRIGWLVLGLVLPACGAEDMQTTDEVGQHAEEIWYGTFAASNLAVVELRRNGNYNNPCTGYFITRRHIVTAAHCTDSYYSTQWYEVKIKTGYNTFAKLKQTNRTDNWVYMSEYEGPGWNWGAQSAAGDFAILTLPSSAWGSVPAGQQILRVSTAPPVVNQGLEIWGWGAWEVLGVGGAQLPNDLLTGNNGSQIYPSSVGVGSFSAITNTNARTCVGDSGGPATRYYSGNYVATGTHRGSSVPGCATSGSTMYWSNTSNKVSFIETVLRYSYGSSFSCSRYASGSNAYMKCF